MHTLSWIGIGLVSFVGLMILGLTLFALSATFSLPSGPRPGLEDLTLEEATAQLRQSGAEGWDLVERARLLVGDRMAYSRRNSFDSYRTAFRRGYGYCEQSALALAQLLQQLGFDARPVHSEHNHFPDRDAPTGHAWVRVFHQGETREIDPEHQDPATGEFLFEPLDQAREYTPLFRVLARWGCAVANAYRYYRTGSDVDLGY
ncbi:MAG: transglutaminase domain-containing protein [Anaerolineae bacterium]